MVFQEQGLAIIMMVTLAVIAILLFFKYSERVTKYKKYIDFFLLFYCIQSMVRHYIDWTILGRYYRYIPFQICYFTMFVYIYYYFSKNRKALPFIHIFGFLGIGALIAPGHQFDFTQFISYVFMIDHIILAVLPFYIVVAHKYYPEYKSLKPIVILFIPFFALGILLSQYINTNNLLGSTGENMGTWIHEANFFFLIRNPITGYAINPWIVAVIQLVCIGVFGYGAIYFGQLINDKVYKVKEKTT